MLKPFSSDFLPILGIKKKVTKSRMRAPFLKIELMKELIKSRVAASSTFNTTFNIFDTRNKAHIFHSRFSSDLEPFYHTRVERFSDCSVKTAFSLKSKWSSSQAAGRAIWNRSSRVIRTPKGPARPSQMSLREPIRAARPHPPLDSHISLRAARFIYYVQPLTPLPSWRRVFQFLISLLPLVTLDRRFPDWHLSCNSLRRQLPTDDLMSVYNGRNCFFISSSRIVWYNTKCWKHFQSWISQF